ncbi:PilX N-terminal [Candidatus Electrothrix aarhusensis]
MIRRNMPIKKVCDAGEREELNAGIVNNEEGFVLVLSLMILVVLTLLGISANRTSLIEVQIAGNENIMKMDFYNAEAAAHEMAQRLENEENPNNLKAARTSFPWLSTSAAEEKLLKGGDEWENKSDESQLSKESQATVEMAALDYGVVKGEKGGSLKSSETRVYFFKLIGRATRDKREKMIEIGYKKRY